MNQIFFLFLSITILSSCSLYNVESEETTRNLYHPKYSISDVQYIETMTQPHEIIGYVTVNTERRNTVEQVIDKLKREAALMGGDAITDIQTDATGLWKRLPAQKLLGNAYVRVNFKAAVVVFLQKDIGGSDGSVSLPAAVKTQPVELKTTPEENLQENSSLRSS